MREGHAGQGQQNRLILQRESKLQDLGRKQWTVAGLQLETSFSLPLSVHIEDPRRYQPLAPHSIGSHHLEY